MNGLALFNTDLQVIVLFSAAPGTQGDKDTRRRNKAFEKETELKMKGDVFIL